MNVWRGISLPAWLLSKSFNCPLFPPSTYYPSPVKFTPICQHVKIIYGLTVLRLEGLDRSEMLHHSLFFFFPQGNIGPWTLFTGKIRDVNRVMSRKGALTGEGWEECVSGWERQSLSWSPTVCWAPHQTEARILCISCVLGAFQVALVVKNPLASVGDTGDTGSIPGSGRSPGEGHGNPFQCSCLESPMDRGTWKAIAHGVTKSQARFSDWACTHTHTHTHTHTPSVGVCTVLSCGCPVKICKCKAWL